MWINVKQIPRRDAWDRDYMPADWVKSEPKTDKRIENANRFYICIFLYSNINNDRSQWGKNYV